MNMWSGSNLELPSVVLEERRRRHADADGRTTDFMVYSSQVIVQRRKVLTVVRIVASSAADMLAGWASIKGGNDVWTDLDCKKSKGRLEQ